MPPKSKDGTGGGKATPPSKKAVVKDSEEYKKRRERNNVAVKKSRERSRRKAKETIDKVSKLREENEMLEEKVQLLSKELSVLKDLFLSHAVSDSCPVSTCTANAEAVKKDHVYTTQAPQSPSGSVSS